MQDALKRAGITGRKIERGQIYIVRDEVITLPRERIPGQTKRTIHEHRLILVVQADLNNNDPLYPIVLVTPLTHRADLQGKNDYKLEKGRGGLDEDSLVLLGLIQPILKIDLEDNPIGKLDALTMNDIDAMLAANLGLID